MSFLTPKIPAPPPPPINWEEERAKASEEDRRRLLDMQGKGLGGTILGGEEDLVGLSREGGLISRPTKTTLGG